MGKLVPDQVKELWQRVDQQDLSSEDCYLEQERLLDTYRRIWKNALCLETHQNLQESILWELGQHMECEDPAEILNRCQRAVAALRKEWQNKVTVGDRKSVEQYYDESHNTIYELMWWHTLSEDSSPLAYVTALEFARQQGCRHYLDFGAGVGSGGILFARNGLAVTLADISSPLQRFSQWRLEKRKLPAQFIDLKSGRLPSRAFDMVTAMDVFEHLVDPVETIDQLSDALQPGGFFFARLASEIDEERPQHIVQDFGPTFDHLQKLGFVQVWQDDWLWGHVVFQKP
jgi:2-polyprenyl-3-methyl-5-hydroxy-6-metoxy-1,4-benzoquinol methylase